MLHFPNGGLRIEATYTACQSKVSDLLDQVDPTSARPEPMLEGATPAAPIAPPASIRNPGSDSSSPDCTPCIDP
eukprot:14881113-Alexandrium_andersonii.AAC.1